jgi:hypothetical protein
MLKKGALVWVLFAKQLFQQTIVKSELLFQLRFEVKSARGFFIHV